MSTTHGILIGCISGAYIRFNFIVAMDYVGFKADYGLLLLFLDFLRNFFLAGFIFFQSFCQKSIVCVNFISGSAK